MVYVSAFATKHIIYIKNRKFWVSHMIEVGFTEKLRASENDEILVGLQVSS